MKKGIMCALIGLVCALSAAGCGQKNASVGTEERAGEGLQTEETGQSAEETSADDKAEAGGSGGAREGSPVTFTDALGNSVTVEHPEKTAVLSESYADAWLLAGGTLTAVTEDAENLLASSAFPQGLVNLGSVKAPGVEDMIAADVDFVILSAAIEGHARIRDTLEDAGITAAYFEVEHFEDYKEMMKILTSITGRDDLYQKNVADIETGIEAQIARAAAAKEVSAEGWDAGEDGKSPTVLFLRAFSTGVRAKGSDSMTGRMLKDLGCVNIADNDDSLLEDISMESIIAADPDFIFVTTMGESEEAALSMVEEQLLGNPAWQGLSAVQKGHYYVLPKELFHNKPNSRWEESYRILADDIYGEE